LKRHPEGVSTAKRREERELLFWTIRQTCFAALLAAATICAVVSLFAGAVGGSDLVGRLLAGGARVPLP
jgi:hypothetical protein